MINQDKLQGCTKRSLLLADVINSYAVKNGIEMVCSSGKRSNQENTACGGSLKSLHLIGEAIDFYFQDSNIFKHVSPLFQLYLSDQSAWEDTTQFEVCRGIVNGSWVNHIHVGFGNEGKKISFTGVYK